MTEKVYPKLTNIGKDCMFWKFKMTELNEDEQATGCTYPKVEVIGRTSCEGVIDDVCLYLISGRRPDSLTSDQITKLKITPPSLVNNFSIPPGEIKA